MMVYYLRDDDVLLRAPVPMGALEIYRINGGWRPFPLALSRTNIWTIVSDLTLDEAKQAASRLGLPADAIV